MAGSITRTTEEAGQGITLVTLDWLCDASGAVSGNAFNIRGWLFQAKTEPDGGGTQPSDLYDLTLVDEDSLDLFNGQAANLSNAAAKLFTFDPPLFVDAKQDLDLVISNAGNAKGGLLYLWFRQ